MRNCTRFGIAFAIFSSVSVAAHSGGEQDPSAKKSAEVPLTVVGSYDAPILSDPNDIKSRIGVLNVGATTVATCITETTEQPFSSVQIQNHPNASAPEIGYVALYPPNTEATAPVFNTLIEQLKEQLPSCE